jgi:hypothetical protein
MAKKPSFDELFIQTDAAPDSLPTSTPGNVPIQSRKVHKEALYIWLSKPLSSPVKVSTISANSQGRVEGRRPQLEEQVWATQKDED